MQLDVTGLVDAVDVAEAGGDGEVGGDGGEGLVDVQDILGLGVEGVVVDVLVVDAVFFAAGNADFLSKTTYQDANLCMIRGKRRRDFPTISSHCFIGAALFKYFAVVSTLNSTLSSLRSIMWLLNNGSPCSLLYFSSASIMPSSQGRSFLAQ